MPRFTILLTLITLAVRLPLASAQDNAPQPRAVGPQVQRATLLHSSGESGSVPFSTRAPGSL